jgi:uncharacterized protein (TIGR01244 family)
MKFFPKLVLPLLFFVSPLFAGEDVATPTVDEIRSDPGVLDGTKLVSTGQPDEEVLKLAKDAGFTAVIDLRGPSEDRGLDESAAVEALGMKYVALPVTGPDDVTFDNARQLDSILEGLEGPVLMHCASGNRVGALMALRASQNGANAEDAMAAGKAAGLTRLEPVVAEKLAEAPH